MAQNQVTPVGRQETTPGKKAHKGGSETGSKIGAVVGGVVGGVAGAAAGGVGAAPGAMAGAAGGAGLGGMIGNWIDPARGGTDAITRRLEAQGPQIQHSPQSEALKQSLLSLQTKPPEVIQEYQAPLVQAYIASLARDNPKGTA
jgi:hypothetical protein